MGQRRRGDAQPRRAERHEPDRCHPHHPAAALGVVDGLVDEAGLVAGQGRQAGVARGPAVAEDGLLDQAVVAVGAGRALPLSGQPAAIGPPQLVLGVVDPANLVAAAGPDEGLGGEQGHLGVIGDAAAPGREIRQPPGPIATPDLVEGGELHHRSEGVADGTTEQAAGHGVAEDRSRRHEPRG